MKGMSKHTWQMKFPATEVQSIRFLLQGIDQPNDNTPEWQSLQLDKPWVGHQFRRMKDCEFEMSAQDLLVMTA